MMQLVIDSSVAIKWFVPEPLSDKAALILDDYRAGAIEFCAPDLLFAEIGSIVWKKQTLQGFPAADAARTLHDLQQIQWSILASRNLLDEAFRLAVQHRRTVYDCLYVAASLRLNCPLVTADERLVNAISGSLPNVEWLGNR